MQRRSMTVRRHDSAAMWQATNKNATTEVVAFLISG
jgi:hypothetical protein